MTEPPVMTPPKTPWQGRVGYYLIGIAIGLSILGLIQGLKRIYAARQQTQTQPQPATK